MPLDQTVLGASEALLITGMQQAQEQQAAQQPVKGVQPQHASLAVPVLQPTYLLLNFGSAAAIVLALMLNLLSRWWRPSQ